MENLKEEFYETSEEEEDPMSPGSISSGHSDQSGFLFGFSSTMADLPSLHPPVAQFDYYWDTFLENVDPLIKVIHKPTMKSVMEKQKYNLPGLSKSKTAMMFAIYYSTVTSITPEECQAKLGESKVNLLAKYRFGVEQALAQAGFLTTKEIITVKAFVVFLIAARRHDDSRFVWALTGLAIRLAQAIGLHRDGEVFNLSPYDTEMRRRLWWEIVVLDMRAAEDHGTDPIISESSYDTKMPLNLNDDDFDIDSKELPPGRTGCTEMTFCLIRFEVSKTIRVLSYIPPGNVPCRTVGSSLTIEDKEKMIEVCHQKLEARYLRHCDMTVPLYWATATISR